MNKKVVLLASILGITVMAFAGGIYVGALNNNVRETIPMFEADYENGEWVRGVKTTENVNKGISLYEGLKAKDLHFDANKFLNDVGDERNKLGTDANNLYTFFRWRSGTTMEMRSIYEKVTEFNYEFVNTEQDGFKYRKYGKALKPNDSKVYDWEYEYKSDYIKTLDDRRSGGDDAINKYYSDEKKAVGSTTMSFIMW